MVQWSASLPLSLEGIRTINEARHLVETWPCQLSRKRTSQASPMASNSALHLCLTLFLSLLPHSMDTDLMCGDYLLRPRLSSGRRQKSYESPPLSELQRLLWTHTTSTGHVNEVWPHLYLGDAYAARDKGLLSQFGITHILNAADGRFHVNTGPTFYKDMQIDYYGIEADDDPDFNLSIYFYPAARYIRAALRSPRGRIFIHCAMGISRSATLVLAFLMICENMTLVDAIQTVSKHRDICPNSGFLKQLQQLDTKLFVKN
ncbi:dual specificity protein phosphatase 13-like isoform X2 [Rhinatrema bivittatum]|uniref:dual specificity protein phosphatase 13-like isoform X2 n=1 Tax=Rhinatrema bivittatum TaxID=194408 RepID=UPI00112DEC0B|nr:dual specificity protein phosphatase 13-like isoform X2 [Rhinatrema bivittatum]